DNALSIISGATNTVIATLPIGSYPSYPPAFNPSNGDVYVPCLGDGTVWAIPPGAVAPPPPVNATGPGRLLQWNQTSNFPLFIQDGTSCVASGGYAYCVGGYNGTNPGSG